MDASSSSNTTNLDLVKLDCVVVDNSSDSKKISSGSVGGRKSEDAVAGLVELSDDEESSDDLSLVEKEELEDSEDDLDLDEEELDSDDDDEDDDLDEEEEEENRERIRILEEMKSLKALAGFFVHPEKPVKVEATACARNYFSRPSAAENEDSDVDEKEREKILAEARAMKQLAANCLHPERPVDVYAFASRNFFTQPWAVEQETLEEDEERARASEDAKQLSRHAAAFQHPEAPLDIDPKARGRNFFNRFSASESTSDEEEDEQELIMEDLNSLKKLAVDYMHPEKPVIAEDGALFGRNYFTRASAEDQEDEDESDEKEIIMEELAKLKQVAIDYLHPELPLSVDTTAFGRNYYSRASAPHEEGIAESRERERILKEMSLLKLAANDYMHPENPVVAKDATLFGRNFYSRPSVEDQELDEDLTHILADCARLKGLAVNYMHPERPLKVDPSAFGRNYYSRPSAEEQVEDDEEREMVLSEMAALKQTAVNYMHPERPLSVDPAAYGRNCYSRPSADDQAEDDEERDLILSEMAALRQKAVDYMHPELPLSVDPSVFGRNYFGRASADDKESFAAAEQRAQIIKEAANFKEMATAYLHPELPLVSDSGTSGRNYYTRASAAEFDPDDEEERARILQEVAQLKKLAVDYLHPERPVDVDSTAFGRNYFSRYSATEQEDDGFIDEREDILEDLALLKKTAADFMHPERPLSVDATLFGRNFFGRHSAPEQETFGSAENRGHILAEASALKKAAVAYAHPELPLAVDASSFGRSYFSRPSAPLSEEEEERAHILAETIALKKLAVYYQHPETGLDVDSAACARNYFSRASGPELESAEESDERAQILAEAKALKKLAVDYRHPEVSIKTTDPTACGRNYFVRPSATGVAEYISSSGHVNPTEDYHSHADEHSYHDDYGHFDMDEELFYDMRQTFVVPGETRITGKVQISKFTSDEEGELSRSPSSVMLFTGALEDADHPPLPLMG